MWDRLKRWARNLKRDVLTLWFCARSPDTPWVAKLVAALVAAYALSPIDLIPDFIPVLGYLDDLIIVPLGIWLALRLVPGPVLAQCRAQAQAWIENRRDRPRNYFAAALIVALWCLAAWAAWLWLARN